MVKFKFPGKPSKIVSRSLVSAYSVVVPSCDTSSVSEDLCFGLSLFQSTFGDNDEGEPFNGFANEDIDEAKFKKRTHENYLRDKMISRGLCVPTIPLCKIDSTDNQIINVSGRRANSTQSKKCANECLTRPKERKKANKLWLHKRMLNRYHPKIQIRHNFKSLNKNSLMRFKHKTLSANYLSDRYCRKFILPSRSLHSSRVIKPNKRFIDHERNIKLKSAKESQTNQLGDDYFQDDVSPDSDVSFEQDRKRNKIETSSSKVIIREARLNITTETTITGPFSAKKFVDKESRSGVITCGICGSVRFYKYILQTRKFGIYSCEPCRRFILKMIKYSKQPHFDTLKCKADTGIGKCVILPVTSTRRKDSEDPFKNYRCNACLLSLCLQKYIMPASIKKSLIQLIPEEVKSNYLNGLSPPDLKKPLAILEHPLGGLCKPIPTDEGHDKSRKRLNMHNYLRNVRCTKRPIDKYDIRSNKSSSFLHKRNIHQRTNIKNKAPQENPKIKENFTEKDHYIPRGPRIKHVCRSASSVLRTSNNDREIEEPTCPLSDADCGKNSRKNSEPKVADKSNQLPKIRQCDDTIPVLEQASDTDSSKAIASHYGARTLQDFGKQSSDESDENEDKLISTDFWEAYDPDEVYKTGFPLISSESLNVRALCFLCGSAGIEKLLYCVSCCEPYHWYCAEGPSAFRDESELEKCRVNWVCRKCKVCSACGERDSRILTSCQRCKNSYHNECLTNKAQNKRLFKSDRPWVCPTCLKCKSCNSSSVFTYVGNIPLCSQCFKLRQKGSFCPLCQRCYQDDDYNVKMMECGICEKWIHAKCEGISHEKYQILSFLPDTIEFVCRLCCSLPPAQWWLAVEDELKAGYLGILKCLCKNKKVSDLFKESPRKGICRCATKFVKKPTLGSDSEIDSDSCIDADSEAKTISGNESSSSFATADKYDSGVDDVKDSDCSGGSDEGVSDDSERCSFCRYNSETRNKINNDLLRIKAKVHNNQYSSLLSFHQELTGVIEEVEELDLIQSYRESLKKFFPWFDPDCPRNDDVHDVEMAEVCENGQPTSDLVIEKAVAEEEFENLRRLMSADEFDYEKVKQLDLRKCNLCKGTGEAVPSEGGRLIYCGRNEWVHSNCALWSSEVFEEIDGSLQNVHSAISRGRQIRCAVCDKKGASVGCCFKNCIQTYHFQCAKKAECVFLQNRTIYCRSHDTNEIVLPVLTSEKDFEILRPVYIEMDRKKKKLECHSNVKMRVGSLHVENLGKIDPHLSDNPKYILPVYFRCTRLFWSTTKPWKIVQYHIQIKLRYCYQAAKSDSEANYTVDHSHNADRSSSQLSTTGADDEVVKQIVAEMVNKVASKEDYSYISSQSGGDLLSPELQEAIYKDLPNDLLNDKTLHDIWTNYEGGLNYPNEQTTDRNVIIGCKKMPSSRACNGGSRSGKDEKSKSAESTASKATKANESTESARRISDDTRCSKNTKYLRDKNIREGEAPKRTQTTGTETLAEGFYNELYKVKRKINFENPSSGLNTKKKHYDEAYIGDVAPIDFYHEAAERTFKPTYVQSYENILQLDGMVDISDEEPVKCIRCHRTYRTSISFERHLEVCNSDFNDYISSCESDTSSEEEKFTVKTSPPKETVYDVGQQKFMIAIEDQNQVQYGAANMCNMSHNAVYSFSSMQQNHIQGHMNVAPQATFVQKQESITVTQQQPAIHEALKFNVVDEEKIKHEVRADYGGAQYALNGIQADAQYQIQNVAPTYVIQSFPKQEVIPTYVAVDNTISECIQAQETLMQQPQLQLQPIATTVNQPQMNFQPVIPTILGTVMQPGVIETPTYIINAPNPNAELFAPQNNIILPNQPMLFGMETVVSNTVMSSSQFMTTESLGGNIGSSTMYQTTTTQVFQAAKQVPQNNFPSGFIVVNSPIQQATVPVQQPTQVPAAASEKYMYVQVNAENLANFKPPDKPKPVITKAVKNNVTAKDKPTKVMKVKNNKPVSVHAIPQVNLKTYQSDPVRVNGLQKPVKNCQIQGSTFPEPEHPAKPVMAANPIVSDRKRAPQSVPVAQVAPKMNSTMCAAPKPNTMLPVTQVARKPTPPVAQVAPKPNPILQKARYALPAALPKIPVVPEVKKVDKCVNTDVNKVPGVAVASTNTLSNERTIKISYTIDNDAKQNLNMANPIGKSWNLNIPVEKSCQTSTEPISSSKASVEVAPRVKPPLTCPPVEISNQSMPDLGFVPSPSSNNFPKPENTPKIEIKSESEKLFDELLRQHMLSMENSKSTSPDIEQTPVVESKPPENCPKPKLIPIPSKTKYKPQLNDVKRSTVPSEDASSKAYAKKKLLEKENLDKLTLVSEAENSKNWKTASISFEVNAEDGFTYKTNNLMDLWNKIIESVQTSRSKCKLPLLPKNAMVNGDSVYGLLGFENNASKYLLEQLPDAWKCIFYKPVFHKSPMQSSKSSPMKNESGCARTEPFNSSHKYDMFGWLASRHRKPPKFMMITDADIVNGNRRVTSLNLPMAMRFRHLKETAKETVGVFRSDIHGRGLFCLRDIDPGEMVIEYAGEVIRSTLTDKREKYYTSKGIGCYMFRIDDKYVVDATMCGNAARFINHSCEPNCYSRIVDILGKKHILIFALRKIPKGEELTYDYKFPLEDDKIYCHCLSRKCRKYLN